jgi:predicted dehydrogenase
MTTTFERKGMAKPRIALIGCGEQGSGTLLPCALATPEANVTAVCDLDPSRAQTTADRWRIPAWFDHVDSLLSAGAADALVLATTPQGHAAILHRALPLGLPVFVEKPAAVSLAELEPLIALAHRTNSITQVGHNLRFAPAVLHLESILRSADFGTTLLFNARYFASWPRAGRWDLQLLPAFLLTHFIHLIDLALHLFGPAVDVIPRTRVNSQKGLVTVQVELTFADGLQAHLEATNAAPRFHIDMTAVGSGHTIARLVGLRRVEVVSAADRERCKVWEPGQFEGSHHLAGYRGELESFVNSIRTGSSATPSLETAHPVFAILQAIEEEARSRTHQGGELVA